MCVFWRYEGETAEFYKKDRPQDVEIMFDTYARYFRQFGRNWWYNGGLLPQERNEANGGGWVSE